MTKENITTLLINKIDSWKLESLNFKEKRYTNRKSKYKDITMTIRLKKIAILVIQKQNYLKKKKRKT